jgi:hypothetical protein
MLSTASQVLLAYKNFVANRNISHIGLGVSALNTAKTLRREGVAANVLPVKNATELEGRLNQEVSHVVFRLRGFPRRTGSAL